MLGGVLSIAVVGLAVQIYLGGAVATQFAFTNLVSLTDVLLIAPLVLALGAILAVLASGISTYRHIRN